MSSGYDRKVITNIIEKDIPHVFYNYEVKKFLGATQSMIYFVGDNFYHPANSN
jgi:hypothetical protein